MQKIISYKLKNRYKILLDGTDVYDVEYCPMYQRNLKLYKGCDNIIVFDVKTANQKQADIEYYDPKVIFYNEYQVLLFEKLGEIDTDKPGLFTINVTEEDLFDFEPQFINFTVILNSSDEHLLCYTDANFNAKGKGQIYGDVMPLPKPTKVIDSFYINQDRVISSSINLADINNSTNMLYTVGFYPGTYTGTVYFYATLDTGVTYGTHWSLIDSFSITSNTKLYKNYFGLFKHFKLELTTNHGTFEKVLIR
jgi:hypothetical protein